MKNDLKKTIKSSMNLIKNDSLLYGTICLFLGFVGTKVFEEYPMHITVLIILAIAISIIRALIDRGKRKDSGQRIEKEELEKCEGLVVFASILRSEKEDVEKKIKELNISNYSAMKKLFEEEIGIGQTLRAIFYHRENLKHCWIFYTDKSEECKDIIKMFIKKLGIIIKIEDNEEKYKVNSAQDSVEIWNKFSKLDFSGLSSVAFDITGGTAPISCAMALYGSSCSPEEKEKINLEYVRQDTNELVKILK